MKNKKNISKIKRKHFGISMEFFIYHTKKDITSKEMDEFGDKIIKMVEKRGWYCGGGFHQVDINGGNESYIHFTPKHIKNFDLKKL